MERYVCIHGHFYQPPRENPWLEVIELQDSAYPYHDWNERITAECYATNAASRILDDENRIESITNNYSKISFDFGPTLLSWLEAKSPKVYAAILDADRESRRMFSGHGSALAQAYNHTILPLSNRRDKYTQVLWGVRDFEHRFGRSPEGMWLPVTAVDLETLEILVELGIRFTLLAPHQARRVRKIGGRAWRDVGGTRIDPTMPYLLRLPSGRTIQIFFYDGPISRAVAFEQLLRNGEQFAQRILGSYSEGREWPQLAHIATDGETYGHHHRHGDMALSFALHHIESNHLAKITNYGEYLERHPPTRQVEIFENTSWSCEHGIERWRSDCGCNSGRHSGWNQGWRAPLREALDGLRDTLADSFEEKSRALLKDPWEARNEYISIVLDRTGENIERFLATHAAGGWGEAEKVTVLKLLELERHAMLMYTSCGWFFDDISGIETVQVIQYAGRAIQLGQELFTDSFESTFFENLARARSNVPEHGDGARVYEEFVKPTMIDLRKVGAHYASSYLFEDYGDHSRIFCYTVEKEDLQLQEAGKTRLAVGRARFTSEITRESSLLSFGVLHLGDHNLSAGVREFRGQEAYQSLAQEVTAGFERADLPEVIRLLDHYFEDFTFSLKSLFRDAQRKILNLILDSTLAEAESAYRQVYEHHAPLMRFLEDLGSPLPRVFHTTAEFVLNANLRRAMETDQIDPERITALCDEAKRSDVKLDTSGLAYALGQTLERIMERFLGDPDELSLLERLEAVAGMVHSLPFEVNLWKTQNLYYEMLQGVLPEFRARSDPEARRWTQLFTSLGGKLFVRVD